MSSPYLNLPKKKYLTSFNQTLINGLEAIVTTGVCEIGRYIVVYANIAKDAENFKYPY